MKRDSAGFSPSLVTARARAARWALLLGLILPVCSHAQAAPVARVAGAELLEALAGSGGAAGAKAAGRGLVEAGGEAALHRLAESVVRQGGDAALAAATRLTRAHGVVAVQALQNAPETARILGLVESLPADAARQALARLAHGTLGRELAEQAGRVGVAALRAEIAHPGLGLRLTAALGKEGAELAARLPAEHALAFARHAGDLALLPAAQQSSVLALMSSQAGRVAAFLARFAERNPGKVLFTLAGATLFLTHSEQILGGDEIAFDADGNPVLISKPGLLGRAGEGLLRSLRPVRDLLLVGGEVMLIAMGWKALRRKVAQG